MARITLSPQNYISGPISLGGSWSFICRGVFKLLNLKMNIALKKTHQCTLKKTLENALHGRQASFPDLNSVTCGDVAEISLFAKY